MRFQKLPNFQSFLRFRNSSLTDLTNKICRLWLSFASVVFLASASICNADADNALGTLVFNQTKAYLSLMQERDYKTQLEYMDDGLRSRLSKRSLAKIDKGINNLTGNPSPKYIAHDVTYYPGKPDHFAFDFYAEASEGKIYVCGYLAWKVIDESEVKLVRVERSVVDASTFQKMDVGKAAQTMASFRCPTQLIEGLLGVKVNVN